MLKRTLFIVGLATISASAAPEYLDLVESTVYNDSGATQKDIATRGRNCFVQLLNNDAVNIADNASSTGILSGLSAGGGGSNSSSIGGSELIISEDLDGGLVVANSRIDFTSRLIAHNLKSKVTLMAKDGRFKIKHTDIAQVQKNTGYTHNDGYNKIIKQWGTGWEKAQKVLEGKTTELADCIVKAKAAEEW